MTHTPAFGPVTPFYYNSGAVTHSSAYNYRANKTAAQLAEKIGEDPTPYRNEAEKILKAMNERLWLPDKGHWAEYQDFMGHKRVHESAAVWTIYHAIDSETANPFQAYQATRYVDTVHSSYPRHGPWIKKRMAMPLSPPPTGCPTHGASIMSPLPK